MPLRQRRKVQEVLRTLKGLCGADILAQAEPPHGVQRLIYAGGDCDLRRACPRSAACRNVAVPMGSVAIKGEGARCGGGRRTSA